jgi:hypothetical protein
MFDVAVVIPTLLRPTLEHAVRSIFAQDLPGRVQILIGIDRPQGAVEMVSRLKRDCPARMALTILDLGYSTAARHGGIHTAWGGGALRTILSFAANSRRVAYLDDDNYWAPNHLGTLTAALDGQAWAYSYRWFVDSESGQVLDVDRWESVGPDKGTYAEKAGGFVDPNCLILDKLICAPLLHLWAEGRHTDGRGADRVMFAALRRLPSFRCTGQATSYYRTSPADDAHPQRLKWIAEHRQKIAGASPNPGPGRDR